MVCVGQRDGSCGAEMEQMEEMDLLGASRLSSEKILQILRHENNLRLSGETRAQFAAVREQPDGWLGVVELLQRQAARDCGVSEPIGLSGRRRVASEAGGRGRVVVSRRSRHAERRTGDGTSPQLHERRAAGLAAMRCAEMLLAPRVRGAALVAQAKEI